MKKGSVVGIIISAVIYLFLYPLAAACGLIHPACYAYVGCRESHEKADDL